MALLGEVLFAVVGFDGVLHSVVWRGPLWYGLDGEALYTVAKCSPVKYCIARHSEDDFGLVLRAKVERSFPEGGKPRARQFMVSHRTVESGFVLLGHPW